ncbi:TPA: hypothetical protein ACQYFN_000560 [Vibrio parahaemolyticus]|uniref:hypothetical protein n=1 Tax=Vibrio parahaemolyticus TaxID=670 RepID=UPI00111FE8EC|nr:hypothetical protein [Vibrio parahaemolyticus]TOJ91136.1 hypothetical protein CGI30_06025 [Vibrio parahaemolyticus]HCG6276361.1 hypothetical protein [Vibrio parahaemolyticus]HCG6280090.1 hypothetical protein [Vibrio parahaemolyticus]
MKELISALTHETVNRLKAPFLGSFILSWIAVNHSYVIEFLFSSSTSKISLVKSSTFDFNTDLLFPLIVALAYTFALPFIQYWIDKLKHLLIERKRIQEHHERRADEYKAQMKASEYQAKSSLSYQQDRLNRDLDNWEQQRAVYEDQIENLQTQINASTEQLKSVQDELEETKNNLKNKEFEANSLLKTKEENQKRLDEASGFYERMKDAEKALENAHLTEIELRELLDTKSSNIVALEDLVLSVYDNMAESDAQIKDNLWEELKNRADINPNMIEVITKSYSSRINKQREKMSTFRPMMTNLRKRQEKRHSQKEKNMSVKEHKNETGVAL